MILASARRYRPQTFEEVIGQETAVRALSNALDTKRLHHAYLFTGTRGVGKTTLARVLAKCLNCERGVSSKPCGVCSACEGVSQGTFVDLIEVDAASRTKVEDTRELLDNVQYLPTQGRCKIYLIDEVHMLSGHSFNALLKTLEEPPAHVTFLLATTDPQKIPPTVLSRCLQFHLWQVPFQKIIDHLANILEREEAFFEKNALSVLARAADGSLRDALSLMDQALAYGNGRIETKSVEQMLGLSSKESLFALLDAVIAGKTQDVMKTIGLLSKHTPDFSGLLNQFLELLHQVAIAQNAPEALEDSVGSRETIIDFSKRTSLEEIQLYYQIGLEGQKDLPYAPSLKMGFEMILLRMVAFQPVKISEAIVVKKEKTIVTPKQTILEKPVVVEKQEKTEFSVEKKDLKNWADIISELNITGLTKILAEHCIIGKWTADSVVLILDVKKNMLLNKRNQDRLEIALREYLGKEIVLKISNGRVDKETPAVQNERIENETNRAARKMVDADSGIQDLINTFGAKVEDISVDRS